MTGSSEWKIPIAFLIWGPFLITSGWRRIKKARLMSNIPSSKARSAAMGLVELSGVARPQQILTAPATQRPCCWWRCIVEEYGWVRSRKRWTVLEEVNSSDRFFMEDATGKVLVDPEGAEFQTSEKIVPLDASTQGIWEPLLTRWGMRTDNVTSAKQRIKEQIIEPGSSIYILGELIHQNDAALINDVVMRAPRQGPFIISTRSETDLTRRWPRSGFQLVFVGGVISILGIWLGFQWGLNIVWILSILGSAFFLDWIASKAKYSVLQEKKGARIRKATRNVE